MAIHTLAPALERTAADDEVSLDERLHRPLWSRVWLRLRVTAWRWLYGWRYGAVGRHAWVQRPLMLLGLNAIHLGERVRIWPMARLEAFGGDRHHPRIVIGDRTTIQPFVHIGAAQRVQIGNDCLIASSVYVTDHDHDWRDPTVPPSINRMLLCKAVSIGDGVWLGERVAVLRGVTIGDGAIIGAGAVVTNDVPARCVAAGVPARVVKRWNATTRQWERPA